MRISVRHTTHYSFPVPVAHGLKRLRLRPKSTHGQKVAEWDVAFDGARPEAEYEDAHSNHTALVSLIPGAQEVTVTCSGLIDTSDTAGIIGHHSGYMPMWRFLDQTPLTEPGARLRALVADIDADPADALACLHALSPRVLAAVAYETGHTDVGTTAEQALAAGRGVCQDHAHIFIGAARALGIPARYVSGYLLLDGLIDQEAGHGWVEAHVGGLGWIGFDISNGICPDDRYIRVATGCDYRDAAPITGIAAAAQPAALSVRLQVARADAAP